MICFEGNPFSGKDLERLIVFLKKMELEYETGIEYTICLLDQNFNIVGTGSVEQNVLKCIAIAPEAQGLGLAGTIISNLIQYQFEKGRSHLFIYTKPENRDLFEELGFFMILMTEDVIFMENRKHGLKKYIIQLIEESPAEALNPGKTIGAIVANCNPFTLGHRYLIEQALKECNYVHLFILSDERSFFKTEERFYMVEEGIRDLKRVVLHNASDFIISAATFPTYFMKEKEKAGIANCRLDLELFGQRIAPDLHITKRFVGTEPSCCLTRSYNKKIKQILPQYGIEIREIERIILNNQAVSASQVRSLLQLRDYDKIKDIVPETTLDYLLKTTSRQEI